MVGRVVAMAAVVAAAPGRARDGVLETPEGGPVRLAIQAVVDAPIILRENEGKRARAEVRSSA